MRIVNEHSGLVYLFNNFISFISLVRKGNIRCIYFMTGTTIQRYVASSWNETEEGKRNNWREQKMVNFELLALAYVACLDQVYLSIRKIET